MKKAHSKKGIQGNALWFILIAIFLLGALTMLITRTSSQSEETGETERETLRAAEIVRYGAGLTTMANTLLMRGCSESQISFEVESTDGYQNPNSPSDESCHMFKPAGAGGKRMSSFGGTDYDVHYISTVNVMASKSGAPDINMLILDVPEELCRAVNKIAGVNVATLPGDAGAAAGVTSTLFTGNLLASGTTITNEASASALSEKKTGCVHFISRDINVIFNVIVNR